MNVSKSQYYEFRYNIRNLGNQNSKYWLRIRDLENSKPEHTFANYVLMYKIKIYAYKAIEINNLIKEVTIVSNFDK